VIVSWLALNAILWCSGTIKLSCFSAPPECYPISEATKSELARYVIHKYDLPRKTQIEVADGAVSEGCYRQLRFFSKSSTYPFEVRLYLSPDRRFLTPDLYDYRVEPSEERQRRQEATQADLTRGNPPSQGSLNAPVTIVLFSDFQCPFCETAANLLQRDVLPKSEGKIRLVFRHLPLPNHDWARAAAEASACGALQSSNAFWAIHDSIFSIQSQISADTVAQKIAEVAKSLRDFNVGQFQQCIDRREATDVILADENLAKLHNVSVTPTLFVNGVKHLGIRSPDEFKLILEEHLRRLGHNVPLGTKATRPESQVHR